MSLIIQLNGIGLTSSSLGYGCAGLMRLTSAKERQSILNDAAEEGVSYFDMARMYGLGQVESEVGKFIRGRRDKFVIATKFGINVSRTSKLIAPAQNIGRSVLNVFPSLRKSVKKKSSSFIIPKSFDLVSAKKSLEESLKALNTDYIDILFLHEPSIDDISGTDVLYFLETSREKGLIKSWGIAGYPEQTLPVLSAYPELAKIVQIPNNIVARQLDVFPAFGSSCVTFSPFSDSHDLITQYMADNTHNCQLWSDELNIDLSDSDNIAMLELKYCLSANPDGIVLFSSGRRDGVIHAANAWQQALTQGTLEKFVNMVNRICQSAALKGCENSC